MSSALVLVLLVAVAYLATHVAYDWIAERLLIVSGAEYLVLGLLLGPQVAGLVSDATLESFRPVVTLALGWVGAIVGMQFYLPRLVAIPGLTYRLAFSEAVATLGVITGLELVAMRWLYGGTPRELLGPALALGAVGAASAPSGIAIVARRIGRRAPVLRQLEVATAIDSLVAVVAFGLLLCVLHPPTPSLARSPTPTEWAVISLAVGGVAGQLFHLFLGDERNVDRLVVALGGAVILASGTAAYLRLSPLLVCLTIGVVLVNTARGRHEIAAVLAKGERPFYYVLLIFAGASWRPSANAALLPVVLFLVARVVVKVGAARIATWASGALPVLGGRWGLALFGQGGLALALALEYLRIEGAAYANVVFTAAVASVLLTDLASARVVRSVLEPLLEPALPAAAPVPAPPAAPSAPAAAGSEGR